MDHEKGHSHGAMEYRFCPRCGGKLGWEKIKPIEGFQKNLRLRFAFLHVVGADNDLKVLS